jgi:hypothetical protein
MLAISEKALNSIPDIVSSIGYDYRACLTPYYTIPTLLLDLITKSGLTASISLVPQSYME